MAQTSELRSPDDAAAAPPRAIGLLYGIGFGGFVDGIVLHQLLQWHHMVSHVADYPTTTVAGLEANTWPTASSTPGRGCASSSPR